jgi:hypothetical protein
LDLVISSRIGLSEFAATRAPQESDGLLRLKLPIRFKLGTYELSAAAIKDLEAIGLVFSEQTVRGTR